MSIENGLRQELLELLVVYRNGTADAEQFARLEGILDVSEEARAFCVDSLSMDAQLYWYRPESGVEAGWRPDDLQSADGEVDEEAEVLAGEHSGPRNAAPFFVPDTSYGATHGSFGYLTHGWPVAYFVATVVCAVGLVAGMLMQVSQPGPSGGMAGWGLPRRDRAAEVVGRITGLVDCRLVESPESRVQSPARDPQLSTLVSVGSRFALSSGLMEITYDTGAKVILQGPCTYEVDSSVGGYLAVGKLTARVEKKAESRESRVESTNQQSPNRKSQIPNPELSTVESRLFAVRTPTAVVTDLGTEFSVEVDEAGQTASYVFRGSVNVRVLDCAAGNQGDSVTLHANESVCTGASEDGGGIVLRRVAVGVPMFGRPESAMKPKLETLDLVDVVAGGDGFSGRRSRGIDPTTGRPGDIWPTEFLQGDHAYHRVEGMPFVDGVFIPDGSVGRVQTDSTGVGFDGFPKTVNLTAGYVWAGGVLPLDPPVDGENTIRTVLGTIDYSSTGHGVLFLHANKGITFDLDAIRRAHPDQRIVRFRSVAADLGSSSPKGEVVSADLWVLVDGQMRFRRREISVLNGEFAVAVPIGEHDRFLTLAATDGGNHIYADLTMFGDPRLELADKAGERRTTDKPTTP